MDRYLQACDYVYANACASSVVSSAQRAREGRQVEKTSCRSSTYDAQKPDQKRGLSFNSAHERVPQLQRQASCIYTTAVTARQIRTHATRAKSTSSHLNLLLLVLPNFWSGDEVFHKCRHCLTAARGTACIREKRWRNTRRPGGDMYRNSV